MKTTTLTLALALAALAAPAAAGSADDDLAVVKKARPPARPGGHRRGPAPARRKDDPQWFRVRIVEKGKKKATVKVNLPLALVHAFGDDVPIPGCGENGRAAPHPGRGAEGPRQRREPGGDRGRRRHGAHLGRVGGGGLKVPASGDTPLWPPGDAPASPIRPSR